MLGMERDTNMNNIILLIGSFITWSYYGTIFTLLCSQDRSSSIPTSLAPVEIFVFDDDILL